jgi:uncharacterized protein DUF4159
MMTRRTKLTIGIVAAMALGGMAVRAQAGRYVQSGNLEDIHNVPYDGKFTIARIRYESTNGQFGFRRIDRKWDHDTPRSERHFMRILSEITTLRPFLDGPNIFTFDDPELMKFPFAYLCEVGFWNPTDKEVEAARSYMRKGGFVLVDDFIGENTKFNCEMQVRRIFPGATLVPIDVTHPIFDSFFTIRSLAMQDPNFGQVSEFYGVFEDNDPKKRMYMVVNYNNDISDYWEWSDVQSFNQQLSNEAYKLGINYVVYAMTH